MNTAEKPQVEFRETAKQQLDQIFDELDRLQAKKDALEKQSQAEYNKRIEELETKKRVLKSNYEELKSASDHKWNEDIEAWESSKQDFKQGFDKLKAIVE